MRRLLVVNHAVELGGAERTLLELLARRPDEVAVTLAVPQEGPLSERARTLGVAVELAGPGKEALGFHRSEIAASPWRLARTAAGLGAGLLRLTRLARKHDRIITNSTKAHLYGSMAARLANRPCVWRLHDVIDEESFSAVVRRLYFSAAKAFPERIVAVSEAAARPLREAGVPSVVARPNGVGIRPVGNSAAVRSSIRTALGIPMDATLCVFVGRLTPQKGLEVLFDALDRLPTMHLAVVGDALFSEAPGYAEKLRALASRFGARVVFTGQREDVPEVLAAADLLVHPAVRPDSLPTVVLEALAAGVPVVATTAGGATEILADQAGGLLVPPGDPNVLAEAIDRIGNEAGLSKRLGARARTRAADYAPDVAYRAVWDELLR